MAALMQPEDPEESSSQTGLGSAVNTVGQGQRVPIGFGRNRVGSSVLSSEVYGENVSPYHGTFKQYGRVIDLISEGNCGGLVGNDGQSIYIDGTPLLDANGNSNFLTAGGTPSIHFSQTYGGTPWRPFEGGDNWSYPNFNPDGNRLVGTIVTLDAKFEKNSTDDSYGVKQYHSRRTTKPNCEGLSGYIAGSSGPRDDSGNEGQGVILGVETSIDGINWVSEYVYNGSLWEKYSGSYNFYARKPAGAGDYWYYRIVYRAGNADTSSFNAPLVTEYYEDSVEHRDYSDGFYIKCMYNSEMFSRTPDREYLCDLHKVPRLDYNAGSGIFGARSASSNPADIIHYLLTDQWYGLGHRIKPEDIDQLSFWEAAEYFDQMIKDPLDGTFSKRYEYNGVIKDPKDALEIIQEIASYAKANLAIDRNGKIHMVYRDDDPKINKIVTIHDVKNQEFHTTGVDKEERLNLITVKYRDRNNEYLETILEDGAVEYGLSDPVDISRRGEVEKELNLLQCTTRNQAARLGRWARYEADIAGESIKFDALPYLGNLRLGDKIAVYDDHYANLIYSGKTRSGSTSTVININLQPSDNSAGAFIELLDTYGEVVSGEIKTVGTLQLELTAPLLDSKGDDFAPANFVSYGIKGSGTTVKYHPRLYRIEAISNGDDGYLNFTATRWYENLNEFIENNLPSFNDPYTYQKIDFGARDPVNSINAQVIRLPSTEPNAILRVLWSLPGHVPPSSVDEFTIEVIGSDGTNVVNNENGGTYQTDFYSLDPQVYTISLSYRNIDGFVSDAVTAEFYFDIGGGGSVAPPTNLRLVGTSGTGTNWVSKDLVFEWDENVGIDVDGYEVVLIDTTTGLPLENVDDVDGTPTVIQRYNTNPETSYTYTISENVGQPITSPVASRNVTINVYGVDEWKRPSATPTTLAVTNPAPLVPIPIAQGAAPIPANPREIKATNVTGETITLSWVPPIDSDYIGVSIEVNGQRTLSSGTEYTFFGLAPNTVYNFTIAYYDVFGTYGLNTVAYQVTTDNPTIEPTPIPTSFNASPGGADTINITWDYPTPTSPPWTLTGFLIEFELVGSGTPQTLPVNSTTARSATIGALTVGAQYDVRMQAVANAPHGSSGWTPTVRVTVVDLGEIHLFVPDGVIFPHGSGGVIPENFIFCDGRQLDIADWGLLYAAIGDTWNTTGDGINTFNIPNFTDGRSLIGAGNLPDSGTRVDFGDTGGNEQVVLNNNNMPLHNHSVTGHVHNQDTLTVLSDSTPVTVDFDGVGLNNVDVLDTNNLSTGGTTNAIPDQTTSDSGSASPDPVDIMNPYATTVFMIKCTGFPPENITIP
ncbi:TPA: fibronectin type III domain-containing protein [Photobacterium damselae]